MKIKFWDRVILFFGALLTAFAGLFLVIIGLQLGTANGSGLALSVRITSIALGVLSLLLASFLFMLPKKLSYSKHDFVVQQTDNGELRIAVKAIENLVQKCIDVHDEIHVVSMKVNNTRNDVVVDLCISLPSNISIPLSVASLQKQIKQYLSASSGIDVKEVRVSVETTDDEADASAYLLAEDQQALVNDEADEKKEKKLPLHQRIFGKDEQQITLPEPPAAEEIPVVEEAAEQPAEEIPAEEAPADEADEVPAAEEEAAPAEEAQAEKEDASNE
ncbi:MAG: alkaline shock response membrane anchor protein AmaP [Clostridia bacterium]|nr:alkaline shock response membrane anchor protein AmaP [Clostridia bacterium]